MAAENRTKKQEYRNKFAIEDVLTQLDNSDRDVSDDSDDNQDSDYYPPPDNDHVSDDEEPKIAVDPVDDPADDPAFDPAPVTVAACSSATNTRRDIRWRHVAFQPVNTEWRYQYPDEPLIPQTPLKYFLNYLPPIMYQNMAQESNIYSLQTTGTSIKTNSFEIQKFVGTSIIMGNLHFPRIRMYWQRATRIPTIADTISVNRYFKLRNNLHVVSSREPPQGNTNKFWKIQPMIDVVRQGCLRTPFEEHNSVDEQMIPFTGRVPAKQVIKSKPNPVGVKNFVICGKSGRARDFILYQGAGTGISPEYRHLGLGASITLQLCASIPKNLNFKVCFDNYFTGIPLLPLFPHSVAPSPYAYK